MFKKILIANRGAVAARLVKTIGELGLKSVVVYSEADKNLAYVKEADEAFLIGPAPVLESYLNQEAILEVVKKTGAEAIHPGYGFLAENAQFAKKVAGLGLTFIGPSAKWLEIMGDKTTSMELMAKHNMPIAPSTSILKGTIEEQAQEVKKLGFPVLIKPACGGGGIGMTPVYEEKELIKALESASSLASRSFGEAAIYAERLFEKPRHVEFQIMADRDGNAIHLFERDCSIQRRRQKVIEEAGAPNIAPEDLEKMAERAADIISKIGYDHICTVETLYEAETGFSFLEVNPRLQVEHAVTEEISGVDIVASQIKLAAGVPINEAVNPKPNKALGHAIEARIYAEDPKRFFPSPGPLKTFRPPQGENIRIETGFQEGDIVTPFYDPMIAQVIVKADNRKGAINLLAEALNNFTIEGIKTNIPFVIDMLNYEPFREGRVNTALTDELLKSQKEKK